MLFPETCYDLVVFYDIIYCNVVSCPITAYICDIR